VFPVRYELNSYILIRRNPVFNKLQIFQNKVLRIITKLPRVTPIETLHEEAGIETIQTHVSRIATKLYLKSQLSDNPQIRQLGQYNPINDEHKRPRVLLMDRSPCKAKHPAHIASSPHIRH
jgi:hypothetical protein